MSNPAIRIRPAAERGSAELGWLSSRHSFSFGSYYDPEHMGFRSLRVINDDRVQPGQGFGTHPHRDMEIVSIVVEGALVAADVVLAAATGAAGVLAGAALWGLHLALTQSLLSALVAAVAPPELRGTAFGVFNLACGVALFVASALAGLLWDAMGPEATFGAGAAFTLLAMGGLWWRRRDIPALSSSN
jgi:hypothetical protein